MRITQAAAGARMLSEAAASVLYLAHDVAASHGKATPWLCSKGDGGVWWLRQPLHGGAEGGMCWRDSGNETTAESVAIHLLHWSCRYIHTTHTAKVLHHLRFRRGTRYRLYNGHRTNIYEKFWNTVSPVLILSFRSLWTACHNTGLRFIM